MEYPMPSKGHSMALHEVARAHERRRLGALRLRATLAREVEHEETEARLRARIRLLRVVVAAQAVATALAAAYLTFG